MSSAQTSGQGVGLKIQDVCKDFGHVVALKQISLDVPPGSLLTLLGPSGCGKSTLLRIIAGFTSASSGCVLLDGDDIAPVPPFRRETAMVFQSYALFPHMSILDNVMFGLKMRNVPRTTAIKRAREALDMVQLSQLCDRYPAQLSGGQQQRTALARALVTDPKVLLLDEPLGALDKNLREEMQTELRKLQQSVGVTTVCVTHDQQEAMAISDYIAVMQGGTIEQFGTPLDIYDRPHSRFVAKFIGTSNILLGVIQSVDTTYSCLALPCGGRIVATNTKPVEIGQKYEIAVRPTAIRLLPEGQSQQNTQDERTSLNGRITYSTVLGSAVNYEVELADGSKISVQVPRAQSDRLHRAGQAVQMSAAPQDCIMLEAV